MILVKLQPDRKGLDEMTQRVSRAVASPRSFQDVTFHIKCSIGVAVYPDKASSLDELLKKADQAMYSVKKQKKHGVAYCSG